MRSDQLEPELLELLGHDGYLTLVEQFGGIRVYIPKDPARSQLPGALGDKVTASLVGRFGSDYLPVPLARDFRARHYRNAGLSNMQIARQLGISESGVWRLFERGPVAPRPRKVDPRQIELFQTSED